MTYNWKKFTQEGNIFCLLAQMDALYKACKFKFKHKYLYNSIILTNIHNYNTYDRTLGCGSIKIYLKDIGQIAKK